MIWFLHSITNNTNYTIFYVLSLSVMPLIIYSLYYQYKVANKWCPLCLAITVILMLQIGLLVLQPNVFNNLSFDFKSFLIFSLSLLFLSTVWSYLKPILIKASKLENIEIENLRFKRNFSIFQILHNEGKTATAPEITGELIFGNPHALNQIILISNPFCLYCKKVQTDIENLLISAHGKFKLTLRFKIESYKKDSNLYKIASHLLHIYHTEGEAVCFKTLKELNRENINLEQWILETDIHFNSAYDKILETQKMWCIQNNINFTPALYLNGKLLPKEYESKDLVFFLEKLIKEPKSSINTDNHYITR